MAATTRRQTSVLTSLRWKLPLPPQPLDVGFRVPALERVREVQVIWAPLRPNLAHRTWNWHRIAFGAEDVWAMHELREGRPTSTVLGLFAARRTAVRLKSGTFYRLDFVEGAPGMKGLGAALIGAAVIRALELNSVGLRRPLLETLKELTDEWNNYTEEDTEKT